MDKEKAVRKILSKFREPRAVLKRAGDASEMLIERANAAPLKISADSPEGAEKMYKSIVSDVREVRPPAPAKPSAPLTAEEKAMREDYKKFLTESDEINTKREAAQGKYDGDGDTEPGVKKTGIVKSASKIDNMFRNKLLNTVASKLGRKTASDDSEANAQDVVELAAEKLGVPADSTLGNAAKAAAVTAIEMAPLNPSDYVGGKVVKGLGEAAKIAKKANMTRKVFEGIKDISRAKGLGALADAVQHKAPIGLDAGQAAKAASQLQTLSTKATNVAEELAKKGAKKVPYTKIFKAR